MAKARDACSPTGKPIENEDAVATSGRSPYKTSQVGRECLKKLARGRNERLNLTIKRRVARGKIPTRKSTDYSGHSVGLGSEKWPNPTGGLWIT